MTHDGVVSRCQHGVGQAPSGTVHVREARRRGEVRRSPVTGVRVTQTGTRTYTDGQTDGERHSQPAGRAGGRAGRQAGRQSGGQGQARRVRAVWVQRGRPAGPLQPAAVWQVAIRCFRELLVWPGSGRDGRCWCAGTAAGLFMAPLCSTSPVRPAVVGGGPGHSPAHRPTARHQSGSPAGGSSSRPILLDNGSPPQQTKTARPSERHPLAGEVSQRLNARAIPVGKIAVSLGTDQRRGAPTLRE